MKRYLHEWIDLFEFLRFSVINSINQRYISLEVFFPLLCFTSFGEMAPHEFFKGTAKFFK